MSLVATDSGGTAIEPISPGTYKARCVQVIDIGTQYSAHYDNSAHKVVVGWEIPSEVRTVGDETSPALVWKRYTCSLHENSNLRAHLESWRSKAFTPDELKGFDLSNILDKVCLLNLTNSPDGKYTNVVAVMSLPKGENVDARKHDLIHFDIDNPDMDVFETFGDKLKETIVKAAEWGSKASAQQVNQVMDRAVQAQHTAVPEDEIPFSHGASRCYL